MTTGEKIKSLRKKQNLSQEQLADRLGLSRQAVSRWETDNAVPETDMIVRLSEIFGVSTDYLLKEDAAEPPELLLLSPPKQRLSTNLVLGMIGTASSILLCLVILLISVANPWMKYENSGLLDWKFWAGNDLVPFAVIIVVAFLIGIYHWGKYYFRDHEFKE